MFEKTFGITRGKVLSRYILYIPGKNPLKSTKEAPLHSGSLYTSFSYTHPNIPAVVEQKDILPILLAYFFLSE